MLQTFRESTGRWVAGIILGLIAVTFVFFGIDFSVTGATFAAKVNGEEISLLEFEREYQQTQNQYQQLYPIELTDDVRRELRRIVIERMVLGTVLQQRVDEVGYRVSDERLRAAIRTTPAFLVGDEFSADTYNARLVALGFSPASYEILRRQELQLTELQEGIQSSAFLTPAEFRRYIELYNERREIAYVSFSVDSFLAATEITDAQIAEHHAANAALYMSAETVDLEYVELDEATISVGVTVSEQELEDAYEEEQERFQTAEERRVRHILVTLEGADEASAETEAAGLLARAQAGEDFAALAAEFSDDAGTKTQGGELGWIARGVLAGPFEDALFAMQAGEIRGPIKTDFGYHIIRLDEIRSGGTQTFAEARDALVEELRTRKAEDLFYEQANRLEELAFDAHDELASVATALNVPLRTLSAYPRSGDPNAFANDAPVVQAAFDEELVASHANSKLIELADDRVLVLRVTTHYPATPLPLEAVTDQIRAELARTAAVERVRAAASALYADVGAATDVGAASAATEATDAADVGAASAATEATDAADVGAASAATPPPVSRDLEALAAAHGGVWNAPRWVMRNAADVPAELVGVAFGAAVPLPVEGVVEIVPMASGDHAVLALYAVAPGDPETVPLEDRDRQQLALTGQSAISEFRGYAADVRDRATVRIPDQILDPQQ
jgi:peptidyl-prolyl cis-trans isomerase D